MLSLGVVLPWWSPTVPWAGATPAGRSVGGCGTGELQETSITTWIANGLMSRGRSGLSFDLGRFDLLRGGELRESTSISKNPISFRPFRHIFNLE
jgi:hypothetical protein